MDTTLKYDYRNEVCFRDKLRGEIGENLRVFVENFCL